MHPIMLPMGMLMRAPAVGGGITSAIEVFSRGWRNGGATQDNDVTMDDSYGSDRWLVGVVYRRNNAATPAAITVDGDAADVLVHQSPSGHGFTWFIAQPTTDTFTVSFTTVSTSNEMALLCYEVRSSAEPTLFDEDSGSVSLSTPSSGVAMLSGIQTSSTVPTNDFGISSNYYTNAGWYWFKGLVYPTSGAALGYTPVNNSAGAISIS